MELYSERGFENTTVAEIARRAGLTERTFFRHYADKREVLFGGAGVLQETLVGHVRDAPAELAPLEAVGFALREAAEELFEGRRALVSQRQAIVEANAELRERELIKLAALASALAEALRARGVGDPAAPLAAEAGIAVFKIAFARWFGDPGGRPLAGHIAETVDELRLVTGAGSPAAGR